MVIYKVSYIGADDNTYNEYFSSKIKAQKAHNKLAKQQKADSEIQYDDQADDDRMVKMLFDMNIYQCKISKKGILEFLNQFFNENF